MFRVKTEGNGHLQCDHVNSTCEYDRGLAPSAPGAYDGEIKESVYTAEYYFYRAEGPTSN